MSLRRYLPVLLCLLCAVCGAQQAGSGSGHATAEAMPDAPGVIAAAVPQRSRHSGQPACQPATQMPLSDPEAMSAEEVQAPCLVAHNPYRLFADSTTPTPMTSRQKGLLAAHDVIDPFNLLTIGANAAITVGANSHTAYGPGLAGFGRLVGYSFVEDATGEFIGTYGICSLAHQDPRYHRDPDATVRRRLLHAVEHTVVSQHDDGRPMLNYETLITYPASAEISNLYVPGLAVNGPSTVRRFMTGLATDPVNNIITEFLPDFARRVHVRVVFAQQILNQIASSQQF